MASLFKTFNYTGVLALSSYTLPFTSFYFKPEFNKDGVRSNTRVLWDFGDGTSSEALTGQHYYRLPGVYTVTCHFYDRFGDVVTDTETVTAINFINNILTTSTEVQPVILIASKIKTPITITRFTSYQTQNSSSLTIVPFASGSYDNYFDTGLVNTYYGHLYPFSSFYQVQPITKYTSEFVEISSFTTSNDNLYYRLSGANIIRCNSTDSGSFFCGSSGSATIYFKSDRPKQRIDLYFGYEPGSLLYASNTYNATLTGVAVLNNTDYSYLSITSCGLESEGTSETSYQINKNKFANTKIGFVVKIKDTENFTLKNPVSSNFILSLKKNSTTYSSAVFASNTSLLSANQLYGVFRGTLTLPASALPINPTTGQPDPLKDVYISCIYQTAYTPNYLTYIGDVLTLSGESIGYDTYTPASSSISLVDSLTSVSISISGRSANFDIYPVKGQYTIAKINEDIDLTQKFKDISLQSLFLDNKVLYDEFLGNIFGTIDSEQTTIGKLTYEKISNFISNNKVLDYSNINNLYSLLEELNIDTLKFSENNYRYPAELSRLIDILSINKSRLFGSVNAFNEDFDTRGYSNSEVYGVNLGQPISIFQTITAGQSLVAYERFGNNFKVISTYQPISAVNSRTYAISSYNDNWGWGLVLPDTGYGSKIKDYYTFYSHISTAEGSIKDSIINFEDTNTTITPSVSSYSEWSKQDGIIANLISNQLYKGLDLFD